MRSGRNEFENIDYRALIERANRELEEEGRLEIAASFTPLEARETFCEGSLASEESDKVILLAEELTEDAILKLHDEIPEEAWEENVLEVFRNVQYDDVDLCKEEPLNADM